jgi:hypothetical protein
MSPSVFRKSPSGTNNRSRKISPAVFSLKMLVSHKEYGSTGKELPPHEGVRFSRKKESGKKDETVIFFRNPAPIQGHPRWGCMDVNS